ncbi:MAG: hypothetical protein ACRD1G_07805, partial [Acidimicrobiales bacterium]
MTLALAIGVVLLGSLYVAVDLQVSHAQAGRDIVEQAALARSVMARITADANSAATLVDPSRFRSANSASGGAAGTT